MSETLLLIDRVRTSIQLGESHFREFKSALEGPADEKVSRDKREIARDICSTLVGFANADGGSLLVGVEDDGKISGIPHPPKVIQYLVDCWNDGVHASTPLIGVLSIPIEVDGQNLIYFQINKGTSHIHLTADGKCLQRRDLETAPVSFEELQFTRLEKTSQDYDRQFVDGAHVADLDQNSVDILANQISRGMSREKCLQHLGLADFDGGHVRLRRAALLLFATDVSRWHPRMQIRVLKVVGTEIKTGVEYNVSADEIIQGNILHLIENSWDLLRPYLVQTKLAGSAKFETRVMYPELACREALINAIAHRDYSQEGRGIEIYIFDDRLEFTSPGALLSVLSIDALRDQTGAHQSRNTYVARVLRELGYMREVGEGVRRIFELMRLNEMEEPALESTKTDFSIKMNNKTIYSPKHLLWLDNFKEFDLTRREKAVVVLGYDNKLISPNDIWNTLGIVDTEDYRQLLGGLQDKGILISALPKPKAQMEARRSRINVRDVPRFRICTPGSISAANESSKTRSRVRKSILINDFNVNSTLFMGNIPHQLSKGEMLEVFRDAGFEVDIRQPRRRPGGRPPSFAFLQFDSEDAATQALAKLDGLEIGGRKLVVRRAYADTVATDDE